MPDPTPWIHAVRSSNDRFTALTAPLTAAEAETPSYADEWSIAQVASHLGSQSEIFGLFLSAGLTGAAPPGGDVFGPIWDRWNALAPADQVRESIAANEAFVALIEQMPADQQKSFALSMFGRDLDLAGVLAMRLGEHAVHTWDIAVALDPTATVAADAVDLLIDTVAQTAGRAGKPADGADPVVIETSAPARRFRLELSPAVVLAEAADDAASGDTADPVQLPAEAFIRLIFGRLDPDHTPADVADDDRLAQLRTVFPGF